MKIWKWITIYYCYVDYHYLVVKLVILRVSKLKNIEENCKQCLRLFILTTSKMCFSGVYYDPFLAAQAADNNYRLQVCRLLFIFTYIYTFYILVIVINMFKTLEKKHWHVKFILYIQVNKTGWLYNVFFKLILIFIYTSWKIFLFNPVWKLFNFDYLHEYISRVE